ncbi:hypothetical protein MKQ68_13285 [Chitinophaga horti]|uniref:Uncharacterized protein n=1 Tax=Chitinophaga horti TaxID=2920382 RepID=A0ABY6IV43_9BACT|nr:hypothetical protein [Chitinophaga horti]UYQ91066.1 hypothetical protein MKQ68_13285 [Chitinophaga horti]
MRTYLKAFAFVAATGAFIFAQGGVASSYAANSKSVESAVSYDLSAYQDTTPKDTTKKKKEKEDTSSTKIIAIR